MSLSWISQDYESESSFGEKTRTVPMIGILHYGWCISERTIVQ